MKKTLALTLALALAMTAVGCGAKDETTATTPAESISIQLSDDGITVDGQTIGSDESTAVYAANDIVYYEEGHDFTYGEGTEADAHTREEAAAHTVIHITEPGNYTVSGILSAGQIAVDLGEEAEDDPNAVVNLYLDNADITCSVAPAVIFYNVYECGDDDSETATHEVDTSAAGANVYINDGTINSVNGSYVARIYEADTVELSEDGTEVVDADKLHKYDAAFYSKQTMNIYGGAEGTGVLNIKAENEGLDSELHLTVNGGNINISSGNDGINTNEDGVSVTTINDGVVNINVSGQTGEGDGIDSNGWLVINGGVVVAAACSDSADAGIDSDMGIHINGGTVVATGHMLDRIEEGGQNYAVFSFTEMQAGGTSYALKNADESFDMGLTLANDFSILLVSSPDLAAGDYTLWQGDTQLTHGGVSFGGGGFGGGMMPRPEKGEMPEGAEPPEMPEGMTPPEGTERPEGGRGDIQMNEDGTVTLPDGTTVDPSQMERPEGGRGPGGMGNQMAGEPGEVSTTFTITDGGSMFSGVSAAA